MKFLLSVSLCVFLCCCQPKEKATSSLNVGKKEQKQSSVTTTSIVILGNVQDAGSPHAGCKKDCCKSLFENPDPERMVVSLGLVDMESEQNWMFEASPDLPRQMKALKQMSPFEANETPNGIFLTHAHIGHYSGLMFLGKESMNADKVPVFAMTKMKTFLDQNGPWSQLVKLENIVIQELTNEQPHQLSPQITVIPFTVPHRDEFSETVGYKINGPNKSALFIPDIDKWEKWERSIVEEIRQVDYALVDATFFDGEEINHRDISQIPHPFVIESMALFKDLPKEEKAKIHFIHLNHTNPLLDASSPQRKLVLENGFKVADFGMVLPL